MAGQHFVVDGYNLIHKIPELRALVDSDLELARDRLVGLLAGYAARRRAAVTVVFDGRRGSAGTRGDSRSGVRVEFARTDADSYIKAMLERAGRAARSTTVVSSDNSIRRHVSDFGAQTVKAEALAGELLQSAQPTAPTEPRTRSAEPVDVDDWLAWFNARRPGFGEAPPARPTRRRPTR
jgi:hypothetical protein